MDKFVEKLISDLHSNNHTAVQESLLQTSFIFEKHRGVGANWEIERRITSLGWSRKVATTLFSDADIVALKAAVIDYFEHNSENENAASALSALSALMDASMKPIFVKALRMYVDTDPGALYQAMIGLEDVGEDVFGGRGSKGITMTEVNIQLGREYLKRLDRMEDNPAKESSL